MKKGYLEKLLRTDQTIFSFKELMLLWGGIPSKTAKNRIHYYIQKKQLYPIHKGLYAKDANYDPFELAGKITPPSYISFETVLSQAGIIFQYYHSIFLASDRSKEVTYDNHSFILKKIKPSILLNNAGIIQERNYTIATPERAFLDTIYLNANFYFDNLSILDWDKVITILPIYNNKRMQRTVLQLRGEL